MRRDGAAAHAERHADGARVLINTRAQVALADPAEKFDPLRAPFAELAALEPVRRRLTETVTGLGTRYEVGAVEPHPLLGRLAPNFPLDAPEGGLKLSTLLHAGRGVLLDLDGPPDLGAEAAGWSDRVDAVAARRPRGCEASALLIRPDGYTVWAAPPGSAGTPRGLRAALQAWFGDARRRAAEVDRNATS